MPQAFESKPTLPQAASSFAPPSPDRQTPKRDRLHKKLPVEAASPPNTTNTHCHSIPQHISNTTLHYTSPHTTARRHSHPRRLFSLSLTAGHSFTFLANPESPGLLAVAEQSATHHGLFVHAKEAKACALCISIPALLRPACRLRSRDLRGSPARVVITASTALNEQRAKSRGGSRITRGQQQTRRIATSHLRRGGKCWRWRSRTEPERSVCRDHN